jgi:aspartate/tyrosine/aromatic aminotransferase
MPFFNEISVLPEDPIFGINAAFAKDLRSNKINLGMGTYRTAEGEPFVLQCVRKAEKIIAKASLNKEYLPIEGDSEFLRHGLSLLLYGKNLDLYYDHIFAVQTLGGCGALCLAAEFLSEHISKNISISQPTWVNHEKIFKKNGLNISTYPYIHTRDCSFDYQGMYQTIQNLPVKSILLLQASCHNPTGIDPTPTQWQEISLLIKKKQLIPLFDVAYQGFGDSLEQDIAPIHQFIQDGHEFLVAYSFSKNFGLYGERVGFLAVISPNAETFPAVKSQLQHYIRANYSNPPLHGARIVSTILKSPSLTSEWKIELQNMSSHLKKIRNALSTILLSKRDYSFFSSISEQKGLFYFSGLNPEQAFRMGQEKGIYIPMNGRFNIARLNDQNLAYVAESLLSMM